MRRSPTREPRREPKDEKRGGLEECLEKPLENLAGKNVISALSVAFINCYKTLLEGGDEVSDYVPMFSRVAVTKLYKAYDCRKVVDRAKSYVNKLFEEASKLFDATFLIVAELKSRLTVWVSAPILPLEINISWDPVLNVPFIPSSSLKGVVRAYIESYSGSRQEILSLKDRVDLLFGSSKEGVGLAHFFDAYPIECGEGNKLMEPDVITPHYSEVGGSIDEASSRPTPLVFPTIARNVKFGIIVAVNYCNEQGGKRLSSSDLNSLIKALTEALSAGIGAKTSVGYGRLSARLEKSAHSCKAGLS